MHSRSTHKKRRRVAAAAVLATATFVAAVTGVGSAVIPDASASTGLTASTTPGPIQIDSSSLTQRGNRLVWNVRLARPFSPTGLTASDRDLCLQIDRRGDAPERACIAGHPDRNPTLVEEGAATAKDRSAHSLKATITRPGARELTASVESALLDPNYRPIRWQAVSSASSQSGGQAPIGAGAGTTFPASPRPLDVHAPQIVGCVPTGDSEVMSGPTDKHEIALTFDDGPSGDPPAMDFVNLLAREHVPATFFEIGDQISEYDPTGSTERAMLADGDMIGDHTWSHPMMTSLSPTEQKAQLEQTVDAIKQKTGFTPCLFRPPYGDVDPQLVSLARSLGLVTVGWDVDPTDWSTPGTAVIYQRVVSHAHNGAIVLQHFGGGPRAETLAALPQEIATLKREGYKFVTVNQLIGVKPVYN
jgi:peptidoglycan-N-acetylglucosamine deacetylase